LALPFLKVDYILFIDINIHIIDINFYFYFEIL